MFDFNKWKKEWRENHKKLGLCIYCNEKAINGEVKCQKHKEKNNKATRKMRGKRKMLGLCLYCGKKIDRAGVRCICCAEKANHSSASTRKKWVQNGRCLRCGANLCEFDSTITCNDCKQTRALEMRNII